MRRMVQKNGRRFNGDVLLVSVDVGQCNHMGYCRAPDGRELDSFSFGNHRRGFERFWAKVEKFRRSKGLSHVVVGMEPTGIYGQSLVHFLRFKVTEIVQVNPMHTKRLKELEGNSPNKTDRKDPRVIADVMELGHALTLMIPEGVEAELRALTHARDRSMGRQERLLNQLHALVSVVFPEFLQVVKNLRTKTALYLLQNHPLPQDILHLGQEQLASKLRKVSRGKIGLDKAQALYSAAKDSVGVKEGINSHLLEIQGLVRLIVEEFHQALCIEKRMASLVQQVPYSRFLLSMKNVGYITAAGLIGEFGNLPAFRTQQEVMKFAGFNLFEISSGKFRGKRRISKRGRAMIRKLMYFLALRSIRNGQTMHKTYLRYIQAGMKKNQAVIAVARKLLGILFALVQNQTTYVEQYQSQISFREAA